MALTGGASKLNIGGLLKRTGGLGAVSQLNPVTAGISAIPALFQAGLGISQEIKADKLAKSQVRPVMGMPGAQQVALANAQNLYGGEAPGIGVARQQLAQSQAGSAANIMNSGGGNAETLAALTRLDQNAGDQGLNLAAMQEQWKAAQAANLQSQLMQAAETQNRQFMYNQDEPYRNAMAASKDLHDAAPQNIFNALTSVGGSVASALGTKKPGTPEAVSPSLDGQRNVTRQLPEPTSLKIGQIGLDPAINQGEGPIDPAGMDAIAPMPKGPYPTGYDPKTGKMSQVAGPQNYNPEPMAPGFTPLQASAPDLTTSLGSSATPSVLGGAYGNVAKIFDKFRGSAAKARETVNKYGYLTGK